MLFSHVPASHCIVAPGHTADHGLYAGAHGSYTDTAALVGTRMRQLTGARQHCSSCAGESLSIFSYCPVKCMLTTEQTVMLQIDALGDVSKQIRGAAAHAMQIVLQQWGLPITLPKLAPAWAHRSDQVKAGALACVTAAIRANPALVSVSTQWQNLILEPAIKLLQEPQR